jgi:hypothetical protein
LGVGTKGVPDHGVAVGVVAGKVVGVAGITVGAVTGVSFHTLNLSSSLVVAETIVRGAMARSKE